MSSLFSKILIANRGEIACRVIRTARRMGIGTVAVFSDADAGALHVELADEAVHLGPAPAGESYLVGEKILAAARRTGAQAVHPGYGFLSENADFAQACEAAGIVFIGPPADAIRTMGLKDEAKRVMERAGVPVVPGYLGKDQDEDRLLAEAGSIGFPVLIKAVAGGGGKGMRKVASAGDFPAALRAAKREAKGAFGNDRVLIEKLIETPRHIEVQVFADGHGNAVHLFERDCSLQRRHQKVVEEAPAPGMGEDLRKEMGAAAVAAAQAIGYRGAGTVEFIVDASKGLQKSSFYFMEMNTRLQVEHPVTEMVTGTDLVEWQIRVAAGDPLPCPQSALAIDGHAIEVRLYAEDPRRGFLPATGTLARFRPAEADDLRIETGVCEGDGISVHYDPMIAKIIAWGEDRSMALARLRRALARTELAGLVTNLDFLRRIAAHADFEAGRVDTGFIDRHSASLIPEEEEPDSITLALATLGVLAAREQRAVETALASADRYSPWHRPSGWRPDLSCVETQEFEDGQGTRHKVDIMPGRGGYRLRIGQDEMTAQMCAMEPDGGFEAEIDGHRMRAAILADAERATIVHEGRTIALRRLSVRFDPEEDAEGPGTVTAPMPGRLVELLVREGESVGRGAALLVLEAMKMEHTLTAPRSGKVARLHAAAGDQLAEGAALVEIEGD